LAAGLGYLSVSGCYYCHCHGLKGYCGGLGSSWLDVDFWV